ncbi:hypothetical protein [Paenibacillus silviterrae]|uniref:hypothetical protein n=1 Tax=Paenibacillus silviterrae TaxID=3242194 RepID=UPI0025437A5A|nr:hypothetical protein [Paenibacillus chinjuensis]
MVQIPRYNVGLQHFDFKYRVVDFSAKKNTTDSLSPLPKPSFIREQYQELRNNRTAGIYSLSQIHQRMIEATRNPQEVERQSSSTSKVESKSLSSGEAVTSNAAIAITVDDIVLSDGTNTYSLGKNVNIKIDDGELIINNTDHYQFNEGSSLKIYQLMSPDASGTVQQNEILVINNGVVTVNGAASFDVYDDGVINNLPGAYRLQIGIVEGQLPGQSSIDNSLLYGNGTDSTPVGTLITHGTDFMLITNDSTEMIFSLQDDRGEYFIWQVHGDPNKITSAFNDIHNRAQSGAVSYDQLQDITRSYGL